MLKLVAPMVGGIEASDGTWIEADEKVDGGPSVLFDAVVLLPSQEGADLLAKEPTARDFVADAFAHLKFIGYADQALPLLKKAGVFEDLRRGLPAARDHRRRQELRRQLPQGSLLAARGAGQAGVRRRRSAGLIAGPAPLEPERARRRLASRRATASGPAPVARG